MRLGCALAVIGVLSCPMMCGAQMVGPTPQPQGIPVSQEEAEQVAPETWAVHVQSTLTWELQPAFRSPYQGPQSLSPAANGRETIDSTLYAGVRPWAGGEIWMNPEVDQGFGLSDTFGVAGYPSGEAYKLGKAEPYILVQRGFLRQTINLSGETEKLEPDLNQLAGTQTANRLVFTIGKYSIVDIFDTNTYAHDPRSDFLNWSIIDQGAFDYAANAWGYTYGGAAEWYQDRWTIRAGMFDLSQAPNTVALSNGGEIGGIGLDRSSVTADRGDCLIELGLTAAGNKHPRAFLRETLGNAEANSGAAAGDERELARELVGHADSASASSIVRTDRARSRRAHLALPPLSDAREWRRGAADKAGRPASPFALRP